MIAISRVGTTQLLLVAFLLVAFWPNQTRACVWYPESLDEKEVISESREEKQTRLEAEVKTKTGDDKLAAYRELVDERFYVPDEIRHQHIQQMLSEYEPLDDPKGIGSALDALARLQFKQGNCIDAAETCKRAMPYGLDCADSIPEIRFSVLCTQSAIARVVGDLKRSCQLAGEAIRFAKPWGDRLPLNRSYRALAMTMFLLGISSEDLPFLLNEYEYAQRRGDLQREAAVALYMGFRLMRDKHYEKSERWLSKAEKLLLKVDSPRLHFLVKLRRIQLDFLVARDKKEEIRAMN